MNKKLTPKQAISKLKHDKIYDKEVIDVLEKVIEEHELMKQTRIIVRGNQISDNQISDDEKIEIQRMIVNNIECGIKLLFDEETLNKLKAFDIVKEIVDFNVYEMQGKYYLTTGNNYRG